MKKFTLLIALLLISLAGSGRQQQGIEVGDNAARVAARAGEFDEDPDSPADEPFSVADLGEIVYVGSGSNVAYLVLQWNTEDEDAALAFGYRYTGTKYGIDMLEAVVKNFPQLYMLNHTTDLGKTVAGLGWDVDHDYNITLNFDGKRVLPQSVPQGLFTTSAYDYDSWDAVDNGDRWQAGWTQRGYWSFWVKDDIADNFSYARKGASSQELTPGCVHGWMFTSFSGGENKWKSCTAPKNSRGTFTVDNINYTIYDTPTASVGVTRSASATGDVVIPDAVTHEGKSYKVIALESSAFAWNGNITSITVGRNVEAALPYAICGMSSLESLTINGNLTTLGSQALSNNAKLTTLSMPENWTAVNPGTSTFYGCSQLTSIPFPDGCDFIPNGYAKNSGVTSFVVPDNVTAIHQDAFSDCENLTEVILSANLKSLGASAFSKSAVEVFDLPISLTDFGRFSLSSSNLKRVIVHATTPVSFDNNFFVFPATMPDDAELLVPTESIVYYQAANEWKRFPHVYANYSEGLQVGSIFTDGVSGKRFRITSMMPMECELTISHGDFINGHPQAVKTQYTVSVDPVYSFRNIVMVPRTALLRRDNVLTKVDVVGIGDYAFYNLISTKKPVAIVDEDAKEASHIKYIGRYAFSNSDMSIVLMPSSVTSLGEGVFEQCSNLNSVIYENGISDANVEAIPARAFYNCRSLTKTDLLSPKLKSVGDQAFYYCDKLKCNNSNHMMVVESVGEKSFYGCSLLGLNMPSTINSIGNEAFASANFAANSNIHLWSDMTIGARAFCSATGITSVTVHEGVASLPDELFSYCTSLTSLNLASSVKSIGYRTFSNCPITSLELPAGLTTLGEWCFTGAKIVELTLPEFLTEVPRAAFEGCQQLKKVNYPSGLRTIGRDAFSMCAFTTVDIPSSVETIGTGAYSYNSAITSVNIPEDTRLTSLTGFNSCNGLTFINIPDAITAIDLNAFQLCTGLTSVTGMKNVTTIGNSAFYGCSGLTSFTLPKGCRSIGKNAFDGCKSLVEFIADTDGGTAFGEYCLRYNDALSNVYFSNGSTFEYETMIGGNQNLCVWNGITTSTPSLSRLALKTYPSTVGFANHFVLHGMKQKFADWNNFTYDVTEIPVVPGFPEEHEQWIDGNHAIILIVPEMELDLSQANVIPQNVPEAFREADFHHFMQTVAPDAMTLRYRKKGTEDWETVQVEFKSSADNLAPARRVVVSMPDGMDLTHGKLMADIPDLEKYTTYEYQFIHGDLSDKVHTFTTGAEATGIEEMENMGVRVYPNPASEVLYVTCNGGVEICNSLGMTVLYFDGNGADGIDISRLAPGLYFVSYLNNGVKTTTRVIVK